MRWPMPAVPFTEITDRPDVGRVFTETVRTSIGEADAAERVRLDAIAGRLQDVAYFDLVDAGWERPAPWFVRRLRMRVLRFPAFTEVLELATWCSGIGSAVAERRTTIRGVEGAHVEAVAQWVHLDPATARPLALPERFMGLFAPSANNRRSRTKLHHAPVPDAAAVATERDFTFRASDVDPAGHVNNAAYWAVLEEELVGRAASAGFDAEIEHRGPTLPGVVRVLGDGDGRRWVLGSDGEVAASFVVAALA